MKKGPVPYQNVMASKGRCTAGATHQHNTKVGETNLNWTFMLSGNASNQVSGTRSDLHPPAWHEAGSGFRNTPHPPAWHEAGSGFRGSLLLLLVIP